MRSIGKVQDGPYQDDLYEIIPIPCGFPRWHRVFLDDGKPIEGRVHGRYAIRDLPEKYLEAE